MFLLGMSTLCFAWTNSLKPKGEEVNINPVEYTNIITTKKIDAREKYALELLQNTWLEITGKKLNVSKVGTPVQGKSICFLPPDPTLGAEGYRIESKNGKLLLTGGTRRGVINAVVALLEEDLGCRWYVLKPRVVKNAGILKVVPRTYIPKLVMREPFYKDAFDTNWAITNRTNQSWVVLVPEKFGGSWNFPRQGFCHTFNTFLPPQLFKTHPEYFAFIDGKRKVNSSGNYAAHLCMTNPEVVKIVAANACKMLRANPTAEIISISQNDGGNGFCKCKKCLAMTKAEGSISGPLLNFVNQVAGLIKKEFPNVKVETLAYLESFYPPRTIRPADNVYIRLCTDTHSWSYPLFFVEESKKFFMALKKWHKIKANILIWDYVADYKSYLRPIPNLWVINHNYNLFLKYNIKGVMFQGTFESFGGADAALKSWIMAKRLWNPEWKLEALLNDFITGYYGNAAPIIAEYFNMQKAEWEKFHDSYKNKLKKPGPVFNFSRNFVWKTRKLLDKALKITKSNPEINEKIKREELNWYYLRLSQGPINKKDIPEFKKDLVKFKEYVKKFNVTRFKEGGNSEQLKEKELEFKCRIADTLYRKPAKGEFLFCPHNVKIWQTGKQTAVRENDNESIILSQNGEAVSWSMQWTLKRVKLVPHMRYRLLVKCKADTTGSDDKLFKIAVHDHATQKQHGIVTVGSNKLNKGKWTVLKGPAFVPMKTGVIFVSPLGGKKLKKLYIDHIKLVPARY
jgi:hypothetical protein